MIQKVKAHELRWVRELSMPLEEFHKIRWHGILKNLLSFNLSLIFTTFTRTSENSFKLNFSLRVDWAILLFVNSQFNRFYSTIPPLGDYCVTIERNQLIVNFHSIKNFVFLLDPGSNKSLLHSIIELCLSPNRRNFFSTCAIESLIHKFTLKVCFHSIRSTCFLSISPHHAWRLRSLWLSSHDGPLFGDAGDKLSLCHFQVFVRWRNR